MWSWIRRRRTAKALSSLVRAHADAGTFSGAVLVAERGVVLIRTAVGLAHRSPPVANTVTTGFRVGSIGKTFTALAVLRLADQGRLDVTDPLARFEPTFPGAADLQLHHLLSNTSGIPDYLMQPALQDRFGDRHTVAEILDYVRDQLRLFDPGARLAYSNTNWVLLARIIERVTGEPFDRALATLVIEPLGLQGTASDRGDGRPDYAQGYAIGEGGWTDATPIDMSLERGAGGIRSTIDDLYRIDRALMGPGFLSGPTLEQMKRPVAVEGAIGYGYGLFSTTQFGRPALGHTGGTFGFTAFWTRYPAEDLVTIVMANVENGSAQALERDLAAVALGEPYQLPVDRRFVEVAPAILSGYVGRYRSTFAGRQIDFAVRLEGRDLVAAFPLLPKARLQPLSESRFFTRLKGGEVIFEFVRDDGAAAVSKIAMDWSGMAMECPRLE